ncbi:amidohydrolase family protein [Rhabdothermincola salaria]|uniref:amidohydrolase family protein n=1 Tax=Rhabdothermincola salaria TaxID=2903142 RepID=UPI001E36E81D|nr:amidohydrolase [Rhabdothermincola salaria]
MTLTAPEPTATESTRTIPRFVSVDDHIIEPAGVWQDRLPEKYKAVGPRLERLRVANLQFNGMQYSFDIVDGDSAEGKWADFWCYEDLKVPMRRIITAVGFPPEERTLLPVTYEEMRKGCWDQTARLEDMDVNHTEASLCFPTFPRFCGQTFTEAKDRELALLCVKAYNDWMVEEWCGGAGQGRLIPLIIVPLWDADLAAEEVRRNAARGVRAVTFSEIPPFLDLPSIHTGYWDPFFQACAETDTVINMHIGSSSRMPATSPDAPAGVQATLSFNNAMGSLADWIFSGILVRYPTLKLAYSEGQMGWIPYALERADSVWREFRGWAFDKEAVPEPPSFYFKRQVFACFFRDNFGLKNLTDVGVDNVTFETDYPHSDSTWPDTKQVFTDMVTDLSDEDVYKLARGNAIRMLSLDLD